MLLASPLVIVLVVASSAQHVKVASVVDMLRKFSVVLKQLATYFTRAFLRVPSVKLVTIEGDLTSGEFFTALITTGCLHITVIEILQNSLTLRLERLGHLLLLHLMLGSLLSTDWLLHLIDGDETEVELSRHDFTLLWVFLFNVAKESRLRSELLLASNTLKDGRHRLVVAAWKCSLLKKCLLYLLAFLRQFLRWSLLVRAELRVLRSDYGARLIRG